MSTAGNHESQDEKMPTVIGINQEHEILLCRSLVNLYGWKWGEDGNLYAPNPKLTAAWRKVG